MPSEDNNEKDVREHRPQAQHDPSVPSFVDSSDHSEQNDDRDSDLERGEHGGSRVGGIGAGIADVTTLQSDAAAPTTASDGRALSPLADDEQQQQRAQESAENTADQTNHRTVIKMESPANGTAANDNISSPGASAHSSTADETIGRKIRDNVTAKSMKGRSQVEKSLGAMAVEGQDATLVAEKEMFASPSSNNANIIDKGGVAQRVVGGDKIKTETMVGEKQQVDQQQYVKHIMDEVVSPQYSANDDWSELLEGTPPNIVPASVADNSTETEEQAGTDAGVVAATLASRAVSGDTTDTNQSSFVFAAPTGLERSQDRNNVVAMRPGAVRIQPSVGGALMELPELVALESAPILDSSNNPHGEEQRQMARIPEDPVGVVVAATLIDEEQIRNDDTAMIQDEARREGEEMARQQIIKNAIVADLADDDAVDGNEDENEGNDTNPSFFSKRQHRIVSVLAVLFCILLIAAAVGGGIAASGILVAGSPSTAQNDNDGTITFITTVPSATPTSLPTQATEPPTAAPSTRPSSLPSPLPTYQSVIAILPPPLVTFAPTSQEFREYVMQIAASVTAESVLENPFSSQRTALDWIFWTDEQLSIDSSPAEVMERYILTTFYYATIQNGWRRYYEMLDPALPSCEWGTSFNPVSRIPAVTCTTDENNQDRLKTISLVQNNMVGSLIPELGSLEYLEQLHLGSNSLFGTIPSELGMMHRLKDFRLGFNIMEGSIPSEIGNMTSLEVLQFDGNAFITGPLPTEIAQLTSLYEFVVEGTGITDVDRMCASTNPPVNFRSDCQSPLLFCSCCSGCCLDGRDCIPMMP